MNIRIFVLSNGDKVVADVIEDGEVLLKVKNPIVLKDVMTAQGISAFPVPLIPTTDTVIKIQKNHVVVQPCPAEKNVEEAYLKLTSSLVIPSNNVVV